MGRSEKRGENDDYQLTRKWHACAAATSAVAVVADKGVARLSQIGATEVNEEREKLADPYAMTVANLRRRSNAVYLACEAPVAEDISKALRWAADEIERLQDAKRRALAIADERAKENVALRAALAAPASEGVRWQPIATVPKNELIDVWTVGWGAEPHRVADCYYDQICGEWRTSRPAGQLLCIKERYITHWMSRPTAPEPADTPDEGPDPLGYAKGER